LAGEGGKLIEKTGVLAFQLITTVFQPGDVGDKVENLGVEKTNLHFKSADFGRAFR